MTVRATLPRSRARCVSYLDHLIEQIHSAPIGPHYQDLVVLQIFFIRYHTGLPQSRAYLTPQSANQEKQPGL